MNHTSSLHIRAERALGDVPVSKIVIAYNDSGARKAIRVSTLSAADIPNDAPPQTQENTQGFVRAVMLAFLGGLILNLMPCVFRLVHESAQSCSIEDGEINKARMQGLAYTLGILALFAVIAGLLLPPSRLAARRSDGDFREAQHPAVILFLAYLFFTLGLNLAGFFDFNFGGSNLSGFNPENRHDRVFLQVCWLHWWRPLVQRHSWGRPWDVC